MSACDLITGEGSLYLVIFVQASLGHRGHRGQKMFAPRFWHLHHIFLDLQFLHAMYVFPRCAKTGACAPSFLVVAFLTFAESDRPPERQR